MKNEMVPKGSIYKSTQWLKASCADVKSVYSNILKALGC